MIPAKDSTTAGLFSSLKFDIPSSIAAFLVALPLCMGIAIASGVPVAAGLMTGIVGGIVVGALAGAPLQVSGPAAGLTVVVYEIVSTRGVGALSIVVLGAGVLQVVAGTFRLGQWFRAVSPAVIHGMLAGIGVLIFASQFHVMVDDKPKRNGIQNLTSIPQAIAKGLPLPSASTTEQRQVRTALLKDVGSLHSRQAALRDAVVAASSESHESTRTPGGGDSFAAEQAEINADLQRLAEQIERNAPTLPDPDRARAAAHEAEEQSIGRSRRCRAERSSWTRDRNSLRSGVWRRCLRN